jgi:hypothetical protein
MPHNQKTQRENFLEDMATLVKDTLKIEESI